VPALNAIPPGCPFHPRCPYAQPGRCDVGAPPALRAFEPLRGVACLRAEEIAAEALARWTKDPFPWR
jgi:peptide/nickel transport system ATP-binding protein